MNDLKYELAYLANLKIQSSGLSYRQIESRVKSLPKVAISRISNYDIDCFKIDKLIDIVNELDLVFSGRLFGFKVEISKGEITLVYLGDCHKVA